MSYSFNHQKQLSEEVAEGSEGKQLTAKKFSAASQRGSTTRGQLIPVVEEVPPSMS